MEVAKLRLDFKESFSYPFQDPKWILKTILAAVCQALIVPSFAVQGFQLAIIRQTANGDCENLPEVDDFGSFGGLWLQGFVVAMVGMLIFSVPACIIIFSAAAAIYVSVGTLDYATAPVALLILALATLAVLAFVLAIAFLAPALVLRYALTGNVSALVDVPTAWGDIQHGLLDYLVIALFPVVVGVVSFFVVLFSGGVAGLIAPFVSVIVLFVQARMIGNYYKLYFQ